MLRCGRRHRLRSAGHVPDRHGGAEKPRTCTWKPAPYCSAARSFRTTAPSFPALRSYVDNYTEKSLIWGENLESVSVEGHGSIDGQGAAFEGPYKVRPYMLRMVNCRDVSIRGVLFKDSPMWVQHYQGCDNVLIDGIAVHSRAIATTTGSISTAAGACASRTARSRASTTPSSSRALSSARAKTLW